MPIVPNALDQQLHSVDERPAQACSARVSGTRNRALFTGEYSKAIPDNLRIRASSIRRFMNAPSTSSFRAAVEGVRRIKRVWRADFVQYLFFILGCGLAIMALLKNREAAGFTVRGRNFVSGESRCRK